jgi:anaerobic selenocysteine-containing dehydrogenase
MITPENIKLVRTVCPAHCGIDACGILAHVKDGKVVKVEPAEFPDPNYRRICLRGLSSLDITYHKDRLQYPMKRVGKRGEGTFERISWDEALDTIAERFKSIAAEHGWPSIGWVLGGPGAGTTKFGAYLRLASLTQSTRVSAWGYGDAGLPCGSRVIFGTQFPYALLFGNMLAGKAKPDVVVVWGANPGESQPLNLMRPIMDAKANGARLAVIDPRFTITASKADAYLGVRPGTDSALALGLMHVIFKEDLHDVPFILRHSTGPYLVRNDTGKYLRGRDIGLEEEEEYVVWDTANDGPALRHADGVLPAIEGACTVNGIACKTAFQLLKALCERYTPAKTAAVTGVDADLIVRLAERIGRAEETIFVTHMGFTRTYHGDISLRALGTVAAVTGNVMATFKGGICRRC